jgi:cobalamin biosynthesis protein CbiG
MRPFHAWDGKTRQFTLRWSQLHARISTSRTNLANELAESIKMPRTSKTAAAADAAGEGQSGANPGATINGLVPTPLEIRFIFALIANLKNRPEVNWDELANAMGLAGKKSTSALFV